MPFALLRFPFLIQKVIFEEMELLVVLFIAMLSKRSNATARACLRHQKYHLRYEQHLSFRLVRKFEEKDGNVSNLLLIDQAWPPMPCPLVRFGNQEVPMSGSCTESFGKSRTTAWLYCDNIPDFALEALRYFSMMLPNLSVTLKFRNYHAETFRDTMHSVEGVEDIKEINVETSVDRHEPDPENEFVKLILDESQRAKTLCVSFRIPNNFVYSTPFKFDSVFMDSTEWISRNTFIKLFLSCKKVKLHCKDYNEEDLTAIFTAWSEDSPLEFLQFFGTPNFYWDKTLNTILERFPEATPVRNGVILLRGYNFAQIGDGKGYLIQQKRSRTTALICIYDQCVLLTTNFERVVDGPAPELIMVDNP